MSKHTSGPWAIGGEHDDSLWIEGPAKLDNVICDIVSRDLECILAAEDWANARLIAAAPDLLEACQQALVALSSYRVNPYMPDTVEQLQDTLRVAIAKAEGAA
jgi:hypothetical protein